MADQQQTIAAAFPTPPPFYTHFTKQNQSRLRQLRKEAGVSQSSNQDDLEERKDVDIFVLPPELRYLIPPSPPSEDKYFSFGYPLDLNAPDATLEDAGIEQLYPSGSSVKLNPQPHLLALARSLLTTFLSLVGILSQNPAEFYGERVEALQTIAFNMHDLINRYRPHQARESLVLMMEERVERLREETRRVREAGERVREIVRGLQDERHGVVDGGAWKDENIATQEPHAEERRIQKQRAAWLAVEQVMKGAVET